MYSISSARYPNTAVSEVLNPRFTLLNWGRPPRGTSVTGTVKHSQSPVTFPEPSTPSVTVGRVPRKYESLTESTVPFSELL